MLRFDAAAKEWRELGVGAIRIAAVKGADGKLATPRLVFSVPFSGRREKVLVNSFLAKDSRITGTASPGAGKPASLTLDLVVAKGGDAKLERYSAKVRTDAQMTGVLEGVKKATADL